MNKHVRWLHQELVVWLRQGQITPAQADAIRLLYPDPNRGLPWGMLIFSGLGAMVIGLGVILLLAYNWQAIPKEGKLALIFCSVAAAHAGGVALFQTTDWRRQLGQALTVLGTMLFGAGIWLVAQVYHIDEHYPNGFLLWGLGAVAMGWALPSVAQGVLAAATLTIWGGSESLGFGTAVHWAPLLLALAVGGLAARERSRLLLAATLAGFYFLLLTNAAQARGTLAFPSALNVSVLLVALGIMARQGKAFPQSADVLTFFGWTGFLVETFLLTFHSVARDALRWESAVAAADRLPLVIYGWLPFVLALAAWAWLAVLAVRRRLQAPSASGEQWLLPLTALLFQVLAVALPVMADGRVEDNEVILAGVLNIIFLAVAAMWMARGCRRGELRPVILGSLLLIALVMARYFDLFESLAWRGLMFLIVGGVLFAEGFFYRRARELAQQEVRA